MRSRTGVLTSNFAEAGGFLRSRGDLTRPDIQLHFVIGMVDNHNRTLHLGHGFSCHVCVLRPASRGRVGITSADPRSAPMIDPRFLSEQADLDTLVRGTQIVRRIFAQPAFAAWPGKELYIDGIQGESELAQAIRERADTVYHPAGTCRMGGDAESVVDPQLRVRGVSGLRVVDASVMPTLISGNTNAPTIMIAEKAADLMRHGVVPATVIRTESVTA
jgi:choline dehydrogenase-like flavoprotein